MPQQVPFYRPDVRQPEIDEIVSVLHSGWLTTGPRVKRFETEFAAFIGSKHAIALNSCTAALHLAVKALGLKAGQAVLVPAVTFAATAEVVRYEGAIPVLVDCDASTLNMDLVDAERKLTHLNSGGTLANLPRGLTPVGVIPVHVGGLMIDIDQIRSFATRHGLWVVEDAAHAFPAAWRRVTDAPWQYCGADTAAVSCFSFYANKTITTGEGGMAVTNDDLLAEQIRLLSLHGLSKDSWGRYSENGSWDYRITAAGYKYNMTDVAAAMGVHQLARAEEMRQTREAIADEYRQRLEDIEEIELPSRDGNRLHAWHLFAIQLRLDALTIDRNQFIDEMRTEGISCSVHWRPLHLHPYYEETFGWRPSDLPVASDAWQRLVSVPLFSSMRQSEIDAVVEAVRTICARGSIRRGFKQPIQSPSDRSSVTL